MRAGDAPGTWFGFAASRSHGYPPTQSAEIRSVATGLGLVSGSQAIVTREFAAKGQEEVFKRELMTRLTSVHVENSGQVFGQNGPICAHFTGKNRLDPLRGRRSWLSRGKPSLASVNFFGEVVLLAAKSLHIVIDNSPQYRVMASLAAKATSGINTFLVAVFLGSLVLAPLPSLAAIILRVEQVDSDVVVTGSGSANLTGLSVPQSNANWSNYITDLEIYVGPAVLASGEVEQYSGLTGPVKIGSNPLTFEIPDPAGSGGDLFGILADNGTGQGLIVLPKDYNSGDSLAAISTYPFLTLAALGLAPGQVKTWSWGIGPDADSLRVEVYGTTPVPAPAPLLGALAAYRTARNLKRRQRAQSQASTKAD